MLINNNRQTTFADISISFEAYVEKTIHTHLNQIQYEFDFNMFRYTVSLD